ncbi:hypothetical protein KSC_003160 [Ktedonobacter sp. SOSP1-52]|uniref:hypothetical protein n=1 Tax=Ktedonobacter sp. SOSP1-52 TaxID=2778366 RepID=UPI0019160C6C|nr:hypothetical protein [Ktedonobacter sp. SOSP1-52]GHO61424.1 hypothetical protein KSC_003160 [Ktedonobacter sp. SOSP1-52]
MSRDFFTAHKDQFPYDNQNNAGGQSTISVIDQTVEKDVSPLRWWYRFTAPKPAPANATLQQRDISRRGRLTSATLLVVILLVLAAEPTAIFGTNKALVFILLIPVFIDIIALIFNRAGKITTAGILVIVGIEVGLVLSILGPALGSGGLTTYALPQYDLLVQAEFVAVTLLPPGTVFLMLFLHCAFIVATIELLPHTNEFAAVLTANHYDLLLRPITLQIIVAIVTYLWVTSANYAIKRADRAEVVAELERREVERQQQEITLKQQLDEGIQQILQTHVEVANGNFSARTPLKQENVLWKIGYSLNNLLARLQSLNQAENELQRARAETARLVEAIQKAKYGQPIKFNRTGTHLDPLILELMGSTSLSNPAKNSQQVPAQEKSPQQPRTNVERKKYR